MTQDGSIAESAVEAVRCLFLARLLEKRGCPEAARHWEARATRWFRKVDSGGDSAPVEGDR